MYDSNSEIFKKVSFGIYQFAIESLTALLTTCDGKYELPNFHSGQHLRLYEIRA